MVWVLDASVALKLVLEEPESDLADRLYRSGPELVVPDFWLNEACNVIWLQAHRGLWSPEHARQGFAFIRDYLPQKKTSGMDLHGPALEIGLSIGHSPYDCLYAAFALEIGAERLVLSDKPFERALHRSGHAGLARLPITLGEWAAGSHH